MNKSLEYVFHFFYFSYLQLENLNDKNSDTVSNHWAEDGIFTVEDLQISHTKIYDFPAYKIRSFTLKKKKEIQSIV